MNPDYGIQKAIGHLQKAHECLNKIDTTRVSSRGKQMLEIELRALCEKAAESDINVSLSFGGKKLQINLTKEQEAALRAQLEIKP